MDKKDIVWKSGFIERYSQLTDIEEFKDYSLRFLRRSIRVNTLKISVDKLKKRLETTWKLDPIPWCSEGFWIEHKDGERKDVGNLPEHALGYFYLQEAASMLPPVILKPQPHETILDMAAAPGSKTSQIAQYMNNTGLLVANDINDARMKPLSINLQRCGVHNTVITKMYGQAFAKSNLQFDRVLIDAPCSGTGTIRKSLKTIGIWNPTMVTKIAAMQKKLIETAFSVLKPGGTMVYSTCSCEPEENEGVVDHLISKEEGAVVESIELPIKKGKPIMNFENNDYSPMVEKTLRIWPQDNDTEGFFVAKIHKKS